MDPTQSLTNLISALEAGNLPAARESTDTLLEWHDRHGFLPNWPDIPKFPVGIAAFELGYLYAAVTRQHRVTYLLGLFSVSTTLTDLGVS